MIISIGTTSSIQVESVQEMAGALQAELRTTEFPEEAAPQPFSDEETLAAAVLRARGSLKATDADIGLGLQDGVTELAGRYYMCSWGALVDKQGRLFVASSTRTPLPEESDKLIKRDRELIRATGAYRQHEAVARSIGAMGLLTDGLVSVQDEYLHILRILLGLARKGSNALDVEDFLDQLTLQPA